MVYEDRVRGRSLPAKVSGKVNKKCMYYHKLGFCAYGSYCRFIHKVKYIQKYPPPEGNAEKMQIQPASPKKVQQQPTLRSTRIREKSQEFRKKIRKEQIEAIQRTIRQTLLEQIKEIKSITSSPITQKLSDSRLSIQRVEAGTMTIECPSHLNFQIGCKKCREFNPQRTQKALEVLVPCKSHPWKRNLFNQRLCGCGLGAEEVNEFIKKLEEKVSADTMMAQDPKEKNTLKEVQKTPPASNIFKKAALQNESNKFGR